MQVYQNRLDSFLQPRRAKGSLKTQKTFKWPHPTYFTATPEALAEAGFYFNPSPEDTDNVTCYMCGKELGDWAEDDDPFSLHSKKCGKKCAWANVRCGLDMDKNEQFIFTDKTRLPTSKNMEKARLETFTFGNGWCHDQEKGHGASSKKMAKAGFIYSPAEVGDDLAACLYCGISLSGWDADDDPTEEHRKRVKKSGVPCPMFPDIIFPKPGAKSRSKTSHVDSYMPTKTFDGEDDVSDAATQIASIASTSTAKTPRASRTAGKGAKTPKGSSRSSSKSRQTSVLETDGEEETKSRPTRASKKGTARARSRSVSRATTVEPDGATEDEAASTRRKTSSSRAKEKAKDVGDATDDDSATTKKKRARSKSKARVSVIPEDTAGEDGDDGESVASSAPKARARSVSRKPSRTLARTASAKLTEDEISPASTQIKKSSSKSTKASKFKAPSSAAALFDEDEDMEVDEPEPPAPAPAPPTRKSSKPLSAAKVAQQEELGMSTGGRKKGGHSHTASTSQRGKSRAAAQVEVEDVEVDEMEMNTYIPPASSTPAESDPLPEPEPEPESAVSTSKKPSKSKSKAKTKTPTEEPDPVPSLELLDADEPLTEVSQVEKAAPAPVPAPTLPKSKSRKPLSRAPSASAFRSEAPASVRHPSESSEFKTQTLGTDYKDIGIDDDVSNNEDTSTQPSAPAASAMKALGKGKPSSKPSTHTKPPSTLARKTSHTGSQVSKSRSGSGSDVEVDAELQVVDISTDEDGGKDERHTSRKNAAPVSESKSQAKITKAKLAGVEALVKSSTTPHFSSSSSSSPDSGKRIASGSVKHGSVRAHIARLEGIESIDNVKAAPRSPVKTLPKEDIEMADATATANANANVGAETEAGTQDGKQELEPKEEPLPSTPPLPATPPRLSTPPPPTITTPAPPATSTFTSTSSAVPQTPLPLSKNANVPNVPLPVPLTPGFKFIPPLSKEPFVDLEVLSEAELSMTVEEWIRYQMGIEYEKFKADGERELNRFLERVEEVKEVIRGL